MGLEQFITERGWVYTGACIPCNGAKIFKHSNHPAFKIQIAGANIMTIRENRNKQNPNDFVNLALIRPNNDVEKIYKSIFGE